MRNESVSARRVAGKELRDVLSSTEALLVALGDEGGAEVDELRERLTNTIADIKKQLGSSFLASARDTVMRARDTVSSIDDFVQERPRTAVALAVGAGILIGFILKD
jgi:ElaB/YqjD/DUF883 family membrane-anchored ribosome-binding protein